MKKTHFLLIFLLILPFFVHFPSFNALAENDILDCTVTVGVCDSANKSFVSSSYNSTTLTYQYDINYSDVETYLLITPSTSLNDENMQLTYVWSNNKNQILSNGISLTLYKETTTNAIIQFGETTYTFTITDQTSSKYYTMMVKLNVSGSLTTSTLSTNFDTSSTITNQTNSFEITIILPISKSYTSVWYIKVPNSSSYIQTNTNNNSYVFSPRDYVNSTNGYGEYKIFAVSTSSDSKVYYSKTLILNVKANDSAVTENSYQITYTLTNNSRYAIEAFEYVLDNAEDLDPSNIYWYINESKICSGFSMTYEPNSTNSYRVSAKYNHNGSVILLSTLLQTPQSTGTNMLILYVFGAVVVLSVIFGISVVRLNKKRDVVW